MEYSLKRICHVAFNVVPVGLRQIFKQEWDFLYKTTPLGEWKDTPQNGQNFDNNESRKSRTKNTRFLAIIQNGDTSDWDCSCLFFAILYSDSIGTTLSPAVRAAVDDIRQIRNDITHINEAKLTDGELQSFVGRVSSAFFALGLPVNEVEEVKNQMSFPTEEVENLKKEVLHLKNELDKTKEENKALKQEINLRLESFCFVAFQPPHEVIRRVSDIQRLSSKMQQLHEGADGVVSTTYLSGIPGCGKTQVTRQLGLQFFSQRSDNVEEMTFVATVNAENIETLTDSYISLSKHLGITEYTLTSLESSRRKKPEETIHHLLRLILPQVRKYSKWLIVADNVVDLKSVRGFLPQTGSEDWGHGQVLITTQDNSAVPHCAPHTYHESLSEGMQEEDAVELLGKVSQINDQEEAKTVAKVLDYQPLALAAAAYYVQTVVKNGSPNYDWRKYLEGFTQSKREVTENVLASESSGYRQTITKVVEMALQRAVEMDEFLRHTFSFFALCAWEVVPLEAVAKFVKARVSDQPEELIKQRILKSCMILVSSEEEEQRVYVSLPNIVHTVIKQGKSCEQEPLEKYQNMAEAVKVFKSMLEAEKENYALLKKLTPHCKSILELMRSRSSSPETPFINMLTPFATVNEVLRWLYTFANACRSVSDYIFAKIVVDLACSLIEDNISDTDEEALMELTARIYDLSGIVYKKIGEYSQAEGFHERSPMIFTRLYGEEHPNVAMSCVHLGNLLFSIGREREAKDLYEKAIAIDKKHYGEESDSVAESYVGLGNVYCSLGELWQAKEMYEKALAIHKNIFGEENARTAHNYNNLGIACNKIGDYKQAKELHEKALTIEKKIIGENNTAVARSYVNLGNVYSRTGEVRKAKELHEKALEIYKITLGEGNGEVATTYVNLGNAFLRFGNNKKAKELYEKALEIRKKIFGEDNADVATSYGNLGNVYFRTGEYSKAKELYEKALEIQKKIFGEENAAVTRTVDRLAKLNDLIGERRQSRENGQLEVD